MKINLGCGKDIKKEWINVDVLKLDGVDITHDLNKYPYPFESNSADYIYIDSVLEHLDDVVKVMNEIYRILKQNGKIKIIVPYYKHISAFSDPTHKHFFTKHSMDYFTDTTFAYNFYTKAKFKCIKFEKCRHGFPAWHIKKYFGRDICFPLFANVLKWTLEKK